MGRIGRKKADKIFNGSKLIVPGQGISTVKVDKNNNEFSSNTLKGSNKNNKGTK
jgi:hypothetical protein